MPGYTLLAVGNSFSQDALRDLHDYAAAVGTDLRCVNLYIGGCNLERHARNLDGRIADYLYEENGVSTERTVSANEVLTECRWDFILTQQASHDSGIWQSYQPHLNRVQEYFRSAVPGAERLLMQTWAYEQDSDHRLFPRYNRDQGEMYERLSGCYARAAAETGLRLIPCGQIIQRLRGVEPFRYGEGGRSLCRDGFHMDWIYGRYALSAVIFTYLFGGDPRANPFIPDGADSSILSVIADTVARFV